MRINLRPAVLRFWREEYGFMLSTEGVLLGSVLVVGGVAGLSSVRDAVNEELSDVATALGNLDQSYCIRGICGHSAFTAGSAFFDAADISDRPAVAKAATNPSAVTSQRPVVCADVFPSVVPQSAPEAKRPNTAPPTEPKNEKPIETEAEKPRSTGFPAVGTTRFVAQQQVTSGAGATTVAEPLPAPVHVAQAPTPAGDIAPVYRGGQNPPVTPGAAPVYVGPGSSSGNYSNPFGGLGAAGHPGTNYSLGSAASYTVIPGGPQPQYAASTTAPGEVVAPVYYDQGNYAFPAGYSMPSWLPNVQYGGYAPPEGYYTGSKVAFMPAPAPAPAPVTVAVGNTVVEAVTLEGLELRFAVSSDTDLKKLAAYGDAVRAVQITGAGITDAGLKTLAGLKSLDRLVIIGATITDAGIKELVEAPKLTALKIVGPAPVTDAVLDTLIGLKSLKHVCIPTATWTEAGRARLAKERPDLNVL